MRKPENMRSVQRALVCFSSKMCHLFFRIIKLIFIWDSIGLIQDCIILSWLIPWIWMIQIWSRPSGNQKSIFQMPRMLNSSMSLFQTFWSELILEVRSSTCWGNIFKNYAHLDVLAQRLLFLTKMSTNKVSCWDVPARLTWTCLQTSILLFYCFRPILLEVKNLTWYDIFHWFFFWKRLYMFLHWRFDLDPPIICV